MECIWMNPNPKVIHGLEKYMNMAPGIEAKLDWEVVSANPNAVHLLFDMDYKYMKQSRNKLHKELLKKQKN